MLRVLACVLLLAATLAGRAQWDAALSHQGWSTEEGLPDASVHQVLQSRDGYLWLATEGGVVRFDGVAFKVYRRENEPAFASNDISAIAQDSSGDLLFGTGDGLLVLHDGVFRAVDQRNGLPSGRVSALAAAGDGAVLVLTGAGLSRWNGHAVEPLRFGQGTAVALDALPDGSVRVVTASDGAFLYRRGVIGPAVERVAGEPLLDVQTGAGTSVWSATPQRVTVTSPGAQRTLQVGRELPGTRVSVLFVDRQGTGWIGTNRGLAMVGATAGAPVREIEALRADSILSVCEDREGNVWIGTEASGLHVLRPRKFRSEASSAGEGITAVIAPTEDLAWFGTRDSGLHRVRAGVREAPVSQGALTSPVILSLASGLHEDLWAGTPDGLNHITDGRQVEMFTSTDGLPDDFVRSLLVDKSGVVWAGTRRGLARIAGKRITTYTQSEGLASDSIGPMLEEQPAVPGRVQPSAEALWIGTSKGLSRFARGRFQNFEPDARTGASIVTALVQTGPARLLIGMHGKGLFVFDGQRFLPLHREALPAEILSLAMDPENYVWMRGTQAIYRARVADLEACARNAERCGFGLQIFNAADGLPSVAPETEGSPQIAITPAGRVWVATRKGLGMADAAHLPWNHVPPPVVLERFTADATQIPLGPETQVIGPGHSRYSFAFVALSYTLPSKVRYRYKLEGLDRNWIEAGVSRVADYTSLPPGRYRFRVQAQNNDGVWNEMGAEVRFRLLPPIYRRWWFAAVLALLLAGLVLLAVRLRERVVQRRFALVLQERNRMAREIHDTLAQDFVSVSLQLDIASGLLRADQKEQALAQLQDTRTLVKEGLQAARQSIWNLRASAGEDSLPTRLTALVARFPVRDGTAPKLSIGGAFRKLPAATEAEVLRIAQESLSNIDRHAGATQVEVNLFYQQHSLSLTVRDDGKGFSPEEAERLQGHYGVRGMHERAATLEAELTISSSPGNGTSVQLVVPLSDKDVVTS